MLRNVYETLLAPSAVTDAGRRQELVTNLILIGSCTATALGLLFTFIASFRQVPVPSSLSPFVLLAIFVGLAALYLVSRRGYYRQSSYIFLLIFFLLSTYAVLAWDIELPQGVLVYSLVIIVAGILLGTKISFVATLIIFLTLLSLTALRDEKIIKVSGSGQQRDATYVDASVYGANFTLITLVAWLSNRETEASLSRVLDSEQRLRVERQLLEVAVDERTQDLEQSQAEKINELQRFAEFGVLSATLMHDLANPLTSVSIELEQLANSEHAVLVERAREGIESMESYIIAARQRLRNEISKTHFNVAEQIDHVCGCLKALADMQRVSLVFELDRKLSLHGNNASFDQIVTNLVVNSIDAYRDMVRDGPRIIWIRCKKYRRHISLEVEDKGSGIASADLARIFEPFYTTKPCEYGSGMGLSITRRAVEKDFGGRIAVKSRLGAGTCITVTLPCHGAVAH